MTGLSELELSTLNGMALMHGVTEEDIHEIFLKFYSKYIQACAGNEHYERMFNSPDIDYKANAFITFYKTLTDLRNIHCYLDKLIKSAEVFGCAGAYKVRPLIF
ncbi:hypothetical protein [Evansella clarkii]|uniref:hypothetical protein n=1 Tax=Evansella clarkii TaxID=79879 RepID=UPI001C4829E3|nr:hypothetical protein [Evansella clarkii]